jgi:hypothetical protein
MSKIRLQSGERQVCRVHGTGWQQYARTAFDVCPVNQPGGLSKKNIPKGITVFKPPPEVAAMAAAHKQQQGGELMIHHCRVFRGLLE